MAEWMVLFKSACLCVVFVVLLIAGNNPVVVLGDEEGCW